MANKNKKQKRVWKISDPSDFKKEQDKIHAAQDDKLKYQRIYKYASATPAEQKEEKARSRIKATRGSGKTIGTSVKGEAEKTLRNLDKRLGQSEKRARERSFQARLGMATSDAEKKRIINQKLESDAKLKLLKKKSKQRKIDAKKQTKKILQQNKEYFNTKNKSKMQKPRVGVDPDAFSRHGGAGLRGKFLKRT